MMEISRIYRDLELIEILLDWFFRSMIASIEKAWANPNPAEDAPSG